MSSEEFKIPSSPSRAEIEEMIERGLVSSETRCTFDYLHKGCWTYTFKVGDKICSISGGEATYERAYGLKLAASYSLGSMIHRMNDD